MNNPEQYKTSPVVPRSETYDGQPAQQQLIDLVIAVQASGGDRGRHKGKTLAERRDHFAAQLAAMSPEALADYTDYVHTMAKERKIAIDNPTASFPAFLKQQIARAR